MEHTAKLIQLPHGVQFPPELDGKIAFDPARRCLVWRGFMTEDELQQLMGLHSDSDYRRAVAALCDGCNRIETPLTRRLNWALAFLVAVCVIAAVIVLVGVAFHRRTMNHDFEHDRSHVHQNRRQNGVAKRPHILADIASSQF